MKTSNIRIAPHLWFNKEAKEAVSYYVSILPNSRQTHTTTIHNTPSGDADIISFELMGLPFIAINGGPFFTLNPSVSLFTYCGSETLIQKLFHELSKEGSVLMPLGAYPWSTRYAWVIDKFGLSWQLDIDDINSSQKIVPTMLFANSKFKQVKGAVDFYTSIFPYSKTLLTSPYDNSANLPAEVLLFAQINLAGYILNLMSSNIPHEFDFNESFSFIIYCDTQEEINFYWEKLSSDGQQQPCGWVKDRYGVSWQIVPRELNGMMKTEDPSQLLRVTNAVLKMYKIDLEIIRSTYLNK